MNTYADKSQADKTQVIENEVSQQKNDGESTFQFIDNRPEAIAQRMLQKMADNSPQSKQTSQLHALVDNYTAHQKQPIQQKAGPEPGRRENKTGMSDQLKSGIETLSGIDASDVRVHYNSSKPAQMNAHAYAQGTDIHIASGQERHLPHEAWHTVQQKQGRVQPTTSVNGTAVNDNVKLEKEADIMGVKALQMKNNANKMDSLGQGTMRVAQLVGRAVVGGFVHYTVNTDELGDGTGTSAGTRAHVNGDHPNYSGDAVDFSYTTYDSEDNVLHNQGQVAADNTFHQPPWDAGHMLAQQNGGRGDNNNWVFKQDPALNQGNSGLHAAWRGHEQTFNGWMSEMAVDEEPEVDHGVWRIRVH